MSAPPYRVDLEPTAASAHDVVLLHSEPIAAGEPRVQGNSRYDSPLPMTVHDLLEGYAQSGFQATTLGECAAILKEMLAWRLSHEPNHPFLTADAPPQSQHQDGIPLFSWRDPSVMARTRARIFLSFTSNMISSGLREALVYLAKNKLVDAICTSAGGVEEDFVKCLGDFVVGSFDKRPGKALRQIGWNRIGNIFVPNENYVKFEDWLQPILDQCLREQKASGGAPWTPSKLIRRLGLAINNPTSLYYWCAVNNIPVFCPNITDGALGDNLFFHAAKDSDQPGGLVIDVVQDVARINKIAISSVKTGIIVLGGGTPKHHICNANLMRNGADFAVYINTAQEFDGCDSGARPDEAVSWGKIKPNAKTSKCYCDATIAFPILVSTVFRDEHMKRSSEILSPDFAANHSLCSYSPSDNDNAQTAPTGSPYILNSPHYALE